MDEKRTNIYNILYSLLAIRMEGCSPASYELSGVDMVDDGVSPLIGVWESSDIG